MDLEQPVSISAGRSGQVKVFGIIDHQSDWYPHNAITTLRKYTSLEFVDSPEDADLIWIFSYYRSLDPVLAPWVPAAYRILAGLLGQSTLLRESAAGAALLRGLAVRKASLGRTPVVASFHHLDPAKEAHYAATLKLIDGIADVVHFFSRVNLDENRRHFRKPMILLPYWIDLQCFFSKSPEEMKRAREAFGIPADRITLGSFQRDTESDGRTPKLEKGPDVFCDIVERLDPKRFLAILAGPRREYIETRLSERGIQFISLGKVPFDRMNDLYACLDYYLVTSRCEGGPQAILEAMAARVRILSTRVGVSDLLSREVVSGGDVVRSFVDALNAPYPDVLEEHANRIKDYDCAVIAPVYERAFEELCARGRKPVSR
jgi:glycosyltransferase involved in cell wall biosynthesis